MKGVQEWGDYCGWIVDNNLELLHGSNQEIVAMIVLCLDVEARV